MTNDIPLCVEAFTEEKMKANIDLSKEAWECVQPAETKDADCYFFSEPAIHYICPTKDQDHEMALVKDMQSLLKWANLLGKNHGSCSDFRIEQHPTLPSKWICCTVWYLGLDD